jgi:hypothetical protein
MLRQVAAALRLVRPRTLAHLTKSANDARAELGQISRALAALRQEVGRGRDEQGAELAALREQVATLAAAQAELTASVDDRLHRLTRRVGDVVRREDQLRAIAKADIALEGQSATVDLVLDAERIGAHVRAAIANSPLQLDPMPHCVVDDLLPDDVYAILIRGIPPVELFSDKPDNKRQLMVPFVLAPAYSRRVWTFMSHVVAEEMMTPVLLQKFREPVAAWLRQNFPWLDGGAEADVPMRTGDGRILLRTRGYRIPPHRDPKWGFVTCLVYLVRPGDSEQWGTQLYSVDGDEEAMDAKPHWIPDARCRLVKEVAFRRNRALVFLNSVGAHGAHIPDDAALEGLERYAYQFRIGPERRAMERLVAALPAERQQVWSGKVSSY